MALKKQSIRKNMTILVEGREILKEELILISEGWTLTQENFFRKMLKQGGGFKINGIKYEISLKRDDKVRSDGTKDAGVKQTNRS